MATEDIPQNAGDSEDPMPVRDRETDIRGNGLSFIHRTALLAGSVLISSWDAEGLGRLGLSFEALFSHFSTDPGQVVGEHAPPAASSLQPVLAADFHQCVRIELIKAVQHLGINNRSVS